MTNTLGCLECDDYARWHVWYKSVSLSIGAVGNIAYNSFCDEHMIEEVKNGRMGSPVVYVRLVDDGFLPDGDRAKKATIE